MAVKPIPEEYNNVTAYLIVDGATRAIDYYKQAFGAEERLRMDGPGGKIGHAELKIGNTIVMLADEHPEMGARGPRTFGGSPVSFMVYVKDCDATIAQAVAAGARITRPIDTRFYGDRNGTIEDPFGHTWTVSTHVEDVSPEEMKRRMEKMMPA